MLLTTHQLGMAEELCDRAAIMRDGQIVADESVAELLGLFRQESYAATFARAAPNPRPDWMANLAVRGEGSLTTITGLRDDAEVHRVLAEARAAGLSLVEVARVKPTLEDVFVRLMDRED